MPCQKLVTSRKGPQKGEQVQCNEKSQHFQVSGRSFSTVMALCKRHRHVMERSYTVVLTMEHASAGPTPLEAGTLRGKQESLL